MHPSGASDVNRIKDYVIILIAVLVNIIYTRLTVVINFKRYTGAVAVIVICRNNSAASAVFVGILNDCFASQRNIGKCLVDKISVFYIRNVSAKLTDVFKRAVNNEIVLVF